MSASGESDREGGDIRAVQTPEGVALEDLKVADLTEEESPKPSSSADSPEGGTPALEEAREEKKEAIVIANLPSDKMGGEVNGASAPEKLVEEEKYMGSGYVCVVCCVVCSWVVVFVAGHSRCMLR